MENRRRSLSVVLPLALLALLLTGCPKRPGSTGATAPPPAGLGTRAGTPSTPAPGTSSRSRPPAGLSNPLEFVASESLKDIHFDFDKYDIHEQQARILDADAAWLKAHAVALILIEGHCDERGTDEYNLALGQRRAKATLNYLIGQGVRENRITLISYGKERPMCSEHNEACWAKNRRAHLLVKMQ